MIRSTRSSLAFSSLLPAALAALPACSSYLFEQKCPEAIKESQINAPAATPTPADILFVVDNSGSMADEQENLARNFEAFITQIAGSGDYQITVVTTDTQTSEGEMMGLLDSQYAPAAPHNLLRINTAACMPAGIEHGCARGPDAAKRIIKSSSMTKEEQIAAFQDNVRVGSCGTGIEMGLAGMALALGKTAPGQCNAGFLRPGANLVVVIVSDENDTDTTPIVQYLQQLGNAKGDYTQIRAAAIVGSVNGSSSNCRIPNNGTCGSLCSTPPPQGSGEACSSTNPCQNSEEFCDSGHCQNKQLQWFGTVDATNGTQGCLWCSYYNVDDCCSALGGSRYVDFVKQVEQRVNAADSSIPISNCVAQPGTPAACLIDSICQDSFSDTLKRIAKELVVTTKYNLSPPAVYPAGVAVTLRGGRFGAGKALTYGQDYTVTPDGATLTFHGENTPSEGVQVEIHFVTENQPQSSGVGACAGN